MKSRDAGFTLLELMVVIALVGILCAIALPALLGTKRAAASKTEVSEFFAELRVRQNQYYNENGAYLQTGTDETDTFPAAPSTTGVAIVPSSMPATWKTLKIRLPETQSVHCAYVVVAGDAANQTVGGQATAMGFVAPAKAWYYLLARCDADADPSIDAWFLESSEASEKVIVNPDQ